VEAGFGGGVGAEAGGGAECGEGADGEQAAAAEGVRDGWGGGTEGEEGGTEVEVEEAVEGLDTRVVDGAVEGERAGELDDDVEAAESGDCGFNGSFGLAAAGEVGIERDEAVGGIGWPPASGPGDEGAGVEEGTDDGAAEGAAGADNEDAPAVDGVPHLLILPQAGAMMEGCRCCRNFDLIWISCRPRWRIGLGC
jgi:hypothetical protein